MKLNPHDLPDHIKRLNPHLVIGRAELPQDEPKQPKRDKPPRRIRQQTKPLLNELETDFLNEWLKVNCADCFIVAQSIRFRLANGKWYKVDFVVSNPFTGKWTAYETKGPWAYKGALDTLKVAATQYPHIVWQLVWREGGEWMFQTVLP